MTGRLASRGAILLALTVTGQARAQATAGGDVGVFSGYMWRGTWLGSQTVLQPGVWFSAGGFTLATWFNYEMADPCGVPAPAGVKVACGGGEFDNSLRGPDSDAGLGSPLSEQDFYATYSGSISEEIGYIFGLYVYTFHGFHGARSLLDTEEIVGSVTYTPTSGPLTLSFFAAYDINNYSGFYLEPSVRYSRSLAPNVSVGVGGSAGFSAGDDFGSSRFAGADNDDGFLFAEDGLVNAQFWLHAPIRIPLGGPVSLSVTPTAYYTVFADDFLRWLGTTSPDPGASCFFNAPDDKDTSGCASGKLWGGVVTSFSVPLGRPAN